MAENGDLIHGIFRPVRYISEGGYGLIYEGKSILDNRAVAMKFVDQMYADLTEREYAMYTYLNAINNPDVERYGIPAIYYFDWYGDYQLMVFSLFESDLSNKAEEGTIQVIDNLILFRDFVRQSKYIHSRKVRHDDIKPDNIMFRKHRSFLIDFNISTKMNERSQNGTFAFLPRSAYQENHERTALDDWESFLYTMSEVNGVGLEWFDRNQFLRVHDSETRRMCGDMKRRTNETIARIKARITDKHLREVFVAFANEAFKESRSSPRYDAFDDMIMKKIALVIGENQPALFSWLSQRERVAAADDLRNNPLLKATDINFNTINYPTVEYDYFAVQRDDMARNQIPSRENYLRRKAEMAKIDKRERSGTSKNCIFKCFR